MKVGMIIRWLPVDLKTGLRRAKEAGAHGVQLWIVDTELEPRKLSPSGRSELVGYIDSLGLERPALCGDLGGFADPATVDERIARTKEMIDLCIDLQTPILSSHIGLVPEDPHSSAYHHLIEAVRDVAEYALDRGCCYATETGADSPERLAQFLSSVHSYGAKVNYDPANLCMLGHDPIAGVDTLKTYIVHTHAKDGLANQRKEMPLGEGDVNIQAYVAQLRAIGYSGYLTIERKYTADPLAEMPVAVRYLKSLEGVDA